MNNENRTLTQMRCFLIAVLVGALFCAGCNKPRPKVFNGDQDVESNLHSADQEEEGRLGSSLESCILKYGDSGVSARSKGDDGRTRAAYIFNTSAYRLNCFFLDGKLECVHYSKTTGSSARGEELSYDEIRRIVKKHIKRGEWYNLSEDGDEIATYRNKIDGYVGMYGDFSDNAFLPDWILIVGTPGGIEEYYKFSQAKSWEEKARLIDEL